MFSIYAWSYGLHVLSRKYVAELSIAELAEQDIFRDGQRILQGIRLLQNCLKLAVELVLGT